MDRMEYERGKPLNYSAWDTIGGNIRSNIAVSSLGEKGFLVSRLKRVTVRGK